MNLAIVLTHNKGDQGNIDQIEALKPLLTLITDTNTDQETGATFNTYHYELNGLGIPHELKLYQIIPFGVDEPKNFYDLDSHNVIYRAGDEDKTGDHPRFFNWGLKRATDYGADAVLHLDDPTSINPKELKLQLQALTDPTDKTEFIDAPVGKLSTLKLLTEVGQLDEAKPVSEAIADLQVAVIDSGMEVKNG